MQLHLYLPDEIAAEIKRRAEARGTSVSKYLAEIVQREVARQWPTGYFEAIVGGWKGELLERPEQGRAEERAAF
jgi:hypothetical protein